MTNYASDTAPSVASSLQGKVSRRGFMGTCGVVSVAGATGAFAAPAFANGPIAVHDGRFAVDSHRIVDGYFAWPRRHTNADVVVVIGESGIPDAASKAIARNHAANGRIAVVPHLAATYRDRTLGGKPALVAAMMSDLPRLRTMLRASGTVSVVAA